MKNRTDFYYNETNDFVYCVNRLDQTVQVLTQEGVWINSAGASFNNFPELTYINNYVGKLTLIEIIIDNTPVTFGVNTTLSTTTTPEQQRYKSLETFTQLQLKELETWDKQSTQPTPTAPIRPKIVQKVQIDVVDILMSLIVVGSWGFVLYIAFRNTGCT